MPTQAGAVYSMEFEGTDFSSKVPIFGFCCWMSLQCWP